MDQKDILNSGHLQEYIDRAGIEAHILQLPVETPTVLAAAEAVGVEPEQIGKSLLFLVNGEPLLVIANGDTQVDYRALAAHLGLNRKRIKLANPNQVIAFSGYLVGTVPPFGHRRPIRTLLESAVAEQEAIYVGGGEINALLRISVTELKRVTGAPYLDLKRE